MPPTPSRTQKGTFAFLFAAAAFFFLWTVSPVWVPVFLGVLMAVVATPLQTRFEKRLPGHPRIVAGLITAVTLVVGAGLLGLGGFVVLRELVHFFADGTAQDHVTQGVQWLHSRRVSGLLARFGENPDHFVGTLKGYVTNLSTHLSAILSSLLAVTSNGLLTLILTAVTSYYLLLEGRNLLRFLVRLLPLPPDETRALSREFREACVGILLGIGLISLYQAITAGIGFWIFGVSKPLVWGALTGATSLIPAVGTGLTCIPLGIGLILGGHVAKGIGLLIYWGVVVVFIPDYILRPKIMEGRMRMHSLLVLISLFGGLEAFGPLGLALGPLFCALFVALLRIYERDYRPPRVAQGPLVPN